jgi:hypothetical protein
MLDLQDNVDILVQKEPLVQTVILGWQDRLVKMERPEHREQTDRTGSVNPDIQALLEKRETRDQKVLWAILDVMEATGVADPSGNRAQLVETVNAESRESREPVKWVRLEEMAVTEHRVNMEQSGLPAQQEGTASLAWRTRRR